MPVFTKDNKSILFIHIPKTGGTTIEKCFTNNGWHMNFYDDWSTQPSMNHFYPCPPQHFHGEIISKLFNLKKFTGIFTLVRNPVDRLKSEYTYRKKYYNLELDIDTWIDNVFGLYNTNPFVYDNHIRPQYNFMVNGIKKFKLENGLNLVQNWLDSLFNGEEKIINHELKEMQSNSQSVVINNLHKVKTFYALDYSLLSYENIN